MIENLRISDLPPYGKLFVGIFAVLMLFVLLWVAIIYYLEKGMVAEGEVPAYLSRVDQTEQAIVSEKHVPDSVAHQRIEEEAELIAEDSEAVLAPIWDTDLAGREVHADSTSAVERFEKTDSTIEREIEKHGVPRGTGYDYNPDDPSREHDPLAEPSFRENIGLAHTHINGQTLLYFALGLVFLFTSATPKTKKIVYWLFGISIPLHVIGLSGEGFHWLFDDLLAISGVAIAVLMAYMLFWIFVDLGKKRRL